MGSKSGSGGVPHSKMPLLNLITRPVCATASTAAAATSSAAVVGLGLPLLAAHASLLLGAHVLTLGGALTYVPCVSVPRSVPGLVTPAVRRGDLSRQR